MGAPGGRAPPSTSTGLPHERLHQGTPLGFIIYVESNLGSLIAEPESIDKFFPAPRLGAGFCFMSLAPLRESGH